MNVLLDKGSDKVIIHILSNRRGDVADDFVKSQRHLENKEIGIEIGINVLDIFLASDKIAFMSHYAGDFVALASLRGKFMKESRITITRREPVVPISLSPVKFLLIEEFWKSSFKI